MNFLNAMSILWSLSFLVMNSPLVPVSLIEYQELGLFFFLSFGIYSFDASGWTRLLFSCILFLLIIKLVSQVWSKYFRIVGKIFDFLSFWPEFRDFEILRVLENFTHRLIVSQVDREVWVEHLRAVCVDCLLAKLQHIFIRLAKRHQRISLRHNWLLGLLSFLRPWNRLKSMYGRSLLFLRLWRIVLTFSCTSVRTISNGWQFFWFRDLQAHSGLVSSFSRLRSLFLSSSVSRSIILLLVWTATIWR